MKKIFSRTNFPIASGGNLYHWNDADTAFSVSENGKYVIAITASANNAAQNKKTDDDDLRVSLDGYEFGKTEVHAEKISWKGFGTSAAWDGASLKGGTKIVYFFVELNAGKHKLEFYADETPVLKEIEIWKIKKGEAFDEIKDFLPSENIDTDEKAIPWVSFVFLGLKPKNFEISAICQSATQKRGNDGDNVKVVVNGDILKNKQAPASDTYKNFYFSGDLDEEKKKDLKLEIEKFVLFEDSVELWYDQKPNLKQVKIEFYENLNEYLDELEDEKLFHKNLLGKIARLAKIAGMKYTSEFLFHALKNESEDLTFKKDDPIVQKIKEDKLAYSKILEIIKKELKVNRLKGDVILDISPEKGDEVNFTTRDLSKSLHGIKSIEYQAIQKEDLIFAVNFILHDIYDFAYKSYSDTDFGYSYITTLINNLANRGEDLNVVNNFNIHIKMKEVINLNE